MAAKEEKTELEKRESLTSIVKGARTAFFVTAFDDVLHARPMANAKVEEDLSVIWFATQKNSGKISEIQKDHHVLLGYTNSTGSEWASVTGNASLVSDRAKIKQLWEPIWKNWFEGPDDPNILLIAVTPTEAEYWDNGSQAIAMIKFALAAVTGKKFDEGENARLKL